MNDEENKNKCPFCESENTYTISRVVGYFSIIENWNKSKISERKRRLAGNYWIPQELGDVTNEQQRSKSNGLLRVSQD